MDTFEAKTGRNMLSLPQRLGEVVIIVFMLLLFGFFVYHQTMNTGFFTEKFGLLEMLCLYIPLLLGFTAPAVRAWMGNRNPARPFEAVSSVMLTLGSLWLLIAFPFNYVHLADALPTGIQFLLAWVTDGIAKLFLLLQIIIGPISALIAVGRYFSSRRHETEPSFKRRAL